MKKLILISSILVSFAFVFTACSTDANNAKNEQLTKDEMYTCTMHNEVMNDKPGKCPKCGMTLVKQRMTDEQMKMMKEGTHTKPAN